MVKHRNFDPEICKILDILEDLRLGAHLRASNLLLSDMERIEPRATADAYAFCMLIIRNGNLLRGKDEKIGE
jgi:hypothetical protein